MAARRRRVRERAPPHAAHRPVGRERPAHGEGALYRHRPREPAVRHHRRIARQKPNLDDLITLERPKGDLTTQGGGWLELSGDTGFYQPQPQLLDLFGNVSLFQEKGNEFHSTSAHLDMNAGTAESDDPVTGQGPFGNITAQGFRILDRGATILFTGHARLDMAARSGPAR